MNYTSEKKTTSLYAEKEENLQFLTEQLITCIGNKRALLHFIRKGLKNTSDILGKKKLKIFDVFSGSGVVSRFFKKYSELLIVNDIEKYSEIINQCYLSNSGNIDLINLKEIYRELQDKLQNIPLFSGIISELYAPKNDFAIQPKERVFYTSRNARYIDSARQYISVLPEDLQKYFLAPLLSEASIHANTAGVFKGFYKDKLTGVGQYGGSKRDALERITADIFLDFPVFSNFESEIQIYRGDACEVAQSIKTDVDIAYCDPPYNQHPYGSNYFMLNVIAEYKRPKAVSRVSGIPRDWIRSDYNKKHKVYTALDNLFENLKARFLLISYNSEGFVTYKEMFDLLKKHGSVIPLETTYNTYRGSRNLRGRSIHVKEFLFLVQKR